MRMSRSEPGRSGLAETSAGDWTGFGRTGAEGCTEAVAAWTAATDCGLAAGAARPIAWSKNARWAASRAASAAAVAGGWAG